MPVNTQAEDIPKQGAITEKVLLLVAVQLTFKKG